jgi:uncharacterized protein YbaR (Trm112 family)
VLPRAVDWVCPKSKLPLVFFPAAGPDGPFYLCPGSRLRYRVENAIPVLLVDEAEELPAAEVERLMAGIDLRPKQR